jgi:lysozyme
MLVEDLDEHPLNVQRVIVNMAFNLGYSRLKGFKRMLAAVSNRDYERAAKEMEDSKWYGQVGRRSKELCRLMEWASDES